MDDVLWREVCLSIGERRGYTFIQSLLNAGLNINVLNNGTTMLSYAAECGNLEIVHFLIQNGADGNVTNYDGTIPLHMAAMYGHNDIVKLFLDLGVQVDSCDNKKWTTLHYAVKATNPEIVDTYLELAQFLVSRHADLNAVNRDGRTPLLLAAQNSPQCVVELLIYLGADVTWCDNNRGTLLHHSCRRGWPGIVRSLVQIGYPIDLNAKTARGLTPLIIAAESSHKDIIELLVDSGANLECASFENWTVLHYACAFGWLDVVRYLVGKGCDLSLKSFRGLTPLFLAVMYSHFTIVEYLLESGGDKCTAVHYACAEGWLNVVEFLAGKGCDLNTQEPRWGKTPLHVASEARNLKIIEYLLRAGADYTIKNFYGKTALNALIHSVCYEGILLFLENGAYFQSDDYIAISEKPFLKDIVLRDMKLCTQVIVNKFNNAALPLIYKIPAVAEMLPPIDKLKIGHNTNVAHGVKYEIQTNGFCDVSNMRPIVLQMLCVESLVDHCNKLNIIPGNGN